jgi:murein DD-endopeptidase MepM/ murein hydrolase activator NlpD
MPNPRSLVPMWRKWMNSKNVFHKKELDEMEDHLIEEIEYLMKHENLNEEEAFHKAVDSIGKKSDLEYAAYTLRKEKTQRRRWSISVSLLLIFVLVGFSAFLWKSFSLEGNHIDKNSPFGYPVDEKIIVPFGWRLHPVHKIMDFHIGVDIFAPQGTEIKTTADGVVIEAGWLGGYGQMVKIQHSDVYLTLYGHCSELLVKVGDTVERGQVIALVGATGIATHPHVHYEIREKDKAIDPIKFNKDLLEKK